MPHRLNDGSTAYVLPNGKIVSGIGGLAQFTDSDGTVYTCDGPSERRLAQHRRAVAELKITLGHQWVARARRAAPAMPTSRTIRRRESHGTRAGHRRRTRATSGPPDDSDPAGPRDSRHEAVTA